MVDGFGSGFKKRSFLTKKKTENKKLNKLKKRKTKKNVVLTNYDRKTLISELGKIKGLPPDLDKEVEKHIRKNQTNIDNKLKKDIVELVPRLRKVQKEKMYRSAMINWSSKLFYNLPHKYRKAYIIALDKDISQPNINGLKFLKSRWKDITAYIGNRDTDIHKDALEFISKQYNNGETIGSQVKFRNIVNDVNNYFDDIIDINDYDNPSDM